MKYAPARLFANGVGIGFDAAVARRVAEIKGLSGTACTCWRSCRRLDDTGHRSSPCSADGETWSDRQLLIAVGNGRVRGGGFYLTPEAEGG